MARKPKKTTQAERERRRKELERRRNDDAVMLVSAETLLDEPSHYRHITPEAEMFAAMMRRLIELLKNEQAKRPAHRPAAEFSTGSEVAGLIAAGKSKKIAIQWVMRRRKLKQATVERRLREHEARRGEK
jgi:hypothetical protein